ncbi:hypothetical protein DF223_03455 [Mycetocola zhujimingii]|uniref:Lipoprotein n=2 Tax=Mycetocola zhujimingii TaxID=2079792 RepID=A0A2U1THN3_9MICO|nr:hypothetical protein DF223_03455 [Mycetocola zhujimingii]
MPTLLRAVVAGLAIAGGAVSLVACAQPSPQPTPTPTAIFASEEEALAAATDTYAKFLSSYEAVSATGGAVLPAVREYVSAGYYEELKSANIVTENGWHTEGSSTFEIRGFDSLVNTAEHAEITLQVCRDVSMLRFLDQYGTDVTPVERLNEVPLLVSFESDSPRSSVLTIRGVGTWQGHSCSSS